MDIYKGSLPELGFTIFLFLALPVEGAPLYTLTNLGYMYGGAPTAINNKGQVTGYNRSTYRDGFLYDSGIFTHLGSISHHNQTVARDINDGGQIIGYSGSAFLYENSAITDLGIGVGSLAMGINESGQIVGSIGPHTDHHAFVYQNGSATDLGTLGGNYSRAYAINESGQIVGFSNDIIGGNLHAFLYDNNTMFDLGVPDSFTASIAKDINDSGQVIVHASSVGNNESFLYENGVMNALGTLGSNYSNAAAINNSGQIVGNSSDTNGNIFAFLYEDQQMLPLVDLILEENLLGWSSILDASDINDFGQIIGIGTYNGQQTGFLLTLYDENNPPSKPIPEPTTLVLMGIGLAGIGYKQHRSKMAA